MKLLVAGGAGYIGSVAVEQLVKAGHSVVVLDNLSLGHRTAVHPDALLEVGDLSDRAIIDQVLRRHTPAAVMHFAAKSLVGESMQDPAFYLGDNVTNALNLLRSMAEHDMKKFILSSTANLFDQPEHIPITENERIIPGSPNGESKYFVERMLHWFSTIYGIRYACLRYFNAAGACEERGEDHDPELHPIPLVLQVALGKRASVKMFGDDYNTIDGTCVRDYIQTGDRNGTQDHRTRDSHRSRPAARRRPRHPGRGERENQTCIGLDAALSRPARHHGKRMALAPGPPQRVLGQVRTPWH